MSSLDKLASLDIESIETKIDSIKVTNRLLNDIMDIVSKEDDDIKKQREYGKITFNIEEGNRTIESHNPDSITEYDLARDIKCMSIRLFSDRKKIFIKLYFKSDMNSYFTVEGIDSRWVNGIVKILEDIFRDKKNTTHWKFFNSKKSCIISVPAAFLLGFIYVTFSVESNKPLIFLLMSFSILSNIHFLVFPRLYGKIETEYYGRVKFRSKIKQILSAIGISVIAGYITQYLPR